MNEYSIPHRGDENDWHSLGDIRLLAQLAALFHDFGKANDAFQKKLKSPEIIADAYRHEWVSLRLFEAFVRQSGGSDQDWLARLGNLADTKGKIDLGSHLQKDDMGKQLTPRPFGDRFAKPKIAPLPPLAQIVGWLVVSHHRIPTPPDNIGNSDLQKLPESIGHDWCGSRPDKANASACWTFTKGLPIDSQHWRKHAAKVAQSILQRPGLAEETTAANLLNSPYALHLSRMALILADRHYSAQAINPDYGDKVSKAKAVYANSHWVEDNGKKKKEYKQRLDEHLIGVQINAGDIVSQLPNLADALPRIAQRHKFCELSPEPFAWQNQAFDCAEGLQARSEGQGFFGINMASTGCGKTLANGRILYALSNPQRGARFTVALGLRTLTLQTGEAYRQRLHLGEADLAVLVGGSATRDLYEYQRDQIESAAAQTGSESSASLLPEHNYVHYEGNLEDGPLKEWLGKSDALRLLDAPVLACTIDHLMPATEGTRGGHQIAPMLRLMTSDLVLDEPDDFAIEDLSALTRLVHWAGLLGSRVLLSSATLPPALVQGLFQAYRKGREEYQRNRGIPGERLAVCCAWFDEFGAEAGEHEQMAEYLEAHRRFVDRRLAKLADASRQTVRRRAKIQPLPITPKQKRADLCHELAQHLQSHLHTLHRLHHSIDPKTGKRASFGLIRMANIDPLFDVALALFELGAEAGCHIHLCAYHSHHPLLIRSKIESVLDAALNRNQPDAVFDVASVRGCLDAHPEQDHIFVVLATAVAEVGRDHDYDWAIVEPSSMRSIIQLAGRVRRHRVWDCPEDQPNIYLLDTNLRHLEHGLSQAAYKWPGFESQNFPLASHQLSELLTPEQWQTLTAAPRIKERDPLSPKHNLADLEHVHIADKMLGANNPAEQKTLPVIQWWETRASLSGFLQKTTPFRQDTRGRIRYALLPDEDGYLDLYCLEDDGRERRVGIAFKGQKPKGPVREIDDPNYGPRITPWAVPRYMDALEELAENQQKELRYCAKQYAVIELPDKEGEQLWRYHWALGFSRYRSS